jgi:hypothetical protein
LVALATFKSAVNEEMLARNDVISSPAVTNTAWHGMERYGRQLSICYWQFSMNWAMAEIS